MASILVVDDDPVIRELVARWLTVWGHRVVTAKNAAEALAELLSNDIALVLTDVQMPKDSGVDLLHYAEKYRPGVRVLLMSGDPNSALERGGPADVLVKPFTREELALTVGRIP